MPRYLVIVDFADDGQRHEPIAGIYVDADSKDDAVASVRETLSTVKLTAFGGDS